MMRTYLPALSVVLLMVVSAPGERSSGRTGMRARELEESIQRLRSLHTPLGKPQPGDWLSIHDEPRETFRAYRRGSPITVGRARRILYIQPIGAFSPAQSNVVNDVASFMASFYGLPTVVRKPLPPGVIPATARRTNSFTQAEQFLTTFILDRVLKPRVPRDAAALLALTATDLWPGRGWNFVFGQASLQNRVGVWSIARYGDPAESEGERQEVLRRAVKVAVHETGHMFSLRHCTLYECGMCGSNSMEEADRRPLWFCPHCMAKLCWATGAEPISRYRQLVYECEKLGLADEMAFYLKCLMKLDVDAIMTPDGRK